MITSTFLLAMTMAAFPSNDAVHAILADRIDVQQRSVGIAVAMIEPAGTRVVCHGRLGTDSGPIGADTVFEIASLTKVVTALALMDAVQRGEVRAEDPVADLLPRNPPLVKADGRPIRLIDLAMHSSGLPMWPPGASPATDFARLATYSREDLLEYLQGYEPQPDDRTWAYSNVAVGLLGIALARRAGTDYATLVRERIALPLGMNDTLVLPTASMGDRIARGHFADLRPAPNWNMPALEGAASLRSTAADLARFAAAFLGYSSTSLAPATAAMLMLRRPGPEPGVDQAIGWLVVGEDDEQYVQFGGATAGFSAFMALRPATRQGVVVLSNSAEPVGDIGNHLIRPDSPLSPARRRIVLPREVLERYVGTYIAEGSGAAFVVAATSAGLTIRPPNLEMAFVMVPETGQSFYVPQLGMSIVFTLDDRGWRLSASRGGAPETDARRVQP